MGHMGGWESIPPLDTALNRQNGSARPSSRQVEHVEGGWTERWNHTSAAWGSCKEADRQNCWHTVQRDTSYVMVETRTGEDELLGAAPRAAHPHRGATPARTATEDQHNIVSEAVLAVNDHIRNHHCILEGRYRGPFSAHTAVARGRHCDRCCSDALHGSEPVSRGVLDL